LKADLELKANKTSVASALHRKANKVDQEAFEDNKNQETKVIDLES
jgi:hypothetical protein